MDWIHPPNLFYRALLKWRGPLQPSLPTDGLNYSLYGLGFPWDSEQAWAVYGFCVVLTFYRHFSLSLLVGNSHFSLKNKRTVGICSSSFLSLTLLFFFSIALATQLSQFPMFFLFTLFSLYLLNSCSILSRQNRHVCNIHLDRLCFSKRMRRGNLIAELPLAPSPSRFFL